MDKQEKQFNKANKQAIKFDSSIPQDEAQTEIIQVVKEEKTYDYNNEPQIKDEKIENPQPQASPPQEGKRKTKSIVMTGILCLALLVSGFFLSAPSESTLKSDAIKAGYSTQLSTGSVLSQREEQIVQQDYTIAHKVQQESTKIYVWDYAAEDGDVVQVFVNDVPVTEPFTIYNAPQIITVPSTGLIQVKGIRDGGGGITYAVHYELNGTTYFNNAPEGGFNTYTLTRN